jgi:hypothetical protein
MWRAPTAVVVRSVVTSSMICRQFPEGAGSSRPGQLVDVWVLKDVCRGHCRVRTLN